uniref:Secreted protein n=1 Tax=Trypanosoma vivax (strain Y486) TaxID=1055687 RepID=G0U7S8_TRYVY|nr:hypothetical protein TVY486_1009810 [Trypanosoma vivax Y486]
MRVMANGNGKLWSCCLPPLLAFFLSSFVRLLAHPFADSSSVHVTFNSRLSPWWYYENTVTVLKRYSASLGQKAKVISFFVCVCVCVCHFWRVQGHQIVCVIGV